jgi:hypothetical protein
LKSKFIKDYWIDLKSHSQGPINLRSIKILDFEKVKIADKFDDLSLYKHIINNLYKGDVYIFKNVLELDFVKNVKEDLVNFSKNNESTFFKMDHKCPNFWRRIDSNNNKKYSLKSVKNAYYFFRWNKDFKYLWRELDKFWSILKLLSGFPKNKFKKSSPEDGYVDRIQIVQYPKNTGYIEMHQHKDTYNTPLSSSIYLSQLGKDFSEGGGYFIDRKKNKIYIESKVKPGDAAIFYPTLHHGVDKVKIDNKIKKNNESDLSRWWCGLYTPESDLVDNRKTSRPIR